MNLEEAVKAWIRAEYQFRFGPQAYRGETPDWLVEAENDLRHALTGEKDVVKAAQILGVIKRPRPRLKHGVRRKWNVRCNL